MACQLFWRDSGDIRLRNDPAALAALIDDRHAAHLTLLHQTAAILERRIRRDRDDGFRHAVFGGQLERIPPLGDGSARDITIGHDANGFAAVARC